MIEPLDPKKMQEHIEQMGIGAATFMLYQKLNEVIDYLNQESKDGVNK